MYRYPVLFAGGAVLGGLLGSLLWGSESILGDGSLNFMKSFVIDQGSSKTSKQYLSEQHLSERATAIGRSPFDEEAQIWDSLQPRIPEHFSICNSEEERAVLAEQLACQATSSKAQNYWKTFEEAESQAIELLQLGKLSEIEKYIACDAIDLTWYEEQCEADAVRIKAEHIEDLLEYADAQVLASARWTRESNPQVESSSHSARKGHANSLVASGQIALNADSDSINISEGSAEQQSGALKAERISDSSESTGVPQNGASGVLNNSDPSLSSALAGDDSKILPAALGKPKWRARSRLVSQYLRMGAPWGPDEEPLEGHTLILLEQKIDGRIYLSGVPVTGIEKSKSQVLY